MNINIRHIYINLSNENIVILKLIKLEYYVNCQLKYKIGRQGYKL